MSYGTVKFALAAFLAISVIVPISAAFGVNGAIFSEEVSPGQELVHVITVGSRETEQPLNMTAEISGFSRSLSGTNIKLNPEDDTGPYTARPFLSVEPESFTLEPGEQKTLLLTGTVPGDVGSGGKYALVTIATAPFDGVGVSASFAIQVLVLLTIKDSELIETGEITDLAASKSDEGAAVDLEFENTGNVHYKPLVGAVLKNEDGEILAEEEPKQSPGTILPTNSRLFKMVLVPEEELAPGTYTVEASVIHEDGTVLDTEVTTFEV